ncbi:MAG: ABC transporter substrate-binding protein [Rhodoferax sp.]
MKTPQNSPENTAPAPLALRRRLLLKTATAWGLGSTALGAWAQGPRTPASGTRMVTVAQIADMSTSQIDVSKDFVIGARAAWADINSKGGLRGVPIQHLVLETDGTASALQGALHQLKTQPQCVALFGCVGHATASAAAALVQRELPDLPHVAPWMHHLDGDIGDNTFPIFASRREQISHALQSLANMGIDSVGVVYANAAEKAANQADIERLGRGMPLRLLQLPVVADLAQLAQTLDARSPRILVFLGGTPELMAFCQGVGQQAQQRYIVAMADVNLQILQQSQLTRHAAVITTQVVPLVNAQAPVVRLYRQAMARLYDESPTPQSLAGFMAARYTFEALKSLDASPSRAALLAALRQRQALDLGGFQITANTQRRSGSYVTQSMLASDGRVVG